MYWLHEITGLISPRSKVFTIFNNSSSFCTHGMAMNCDLKKDNNALSRNRNLIVAATGNLCEDVVINSVIFRLMLTIGN
jgi:hypothetical protein